MSECIEYIGARNAHGYGWRTIHGKQMHASRAAWIEANGKIPDGKQVLHRCDNRACINIDHLYIGTVSDNMKDRAVRGRCKTHKLTPKIAAEIRFRYKSGETQANLAREYQLSSGYLSELVNGRYWK